MLTKLQLANYMKIGIVTIKPNIYHSTVKESRILIYVNKGKKKVSKDIGWLLFAQEPTVELRIDLKEPDEYEQYGIHRTNTSVTALSYEYTLS